jgi:hypothetical protein
VRCLVEGEALEVAEHHRQPECARQAVNLSVQRLGLLTIEHRLIGRRFGIRRRTLDGPVRLGLTMAGEPASGLACRSQRDAVQPVAQQLGFAERWCFAGQNKENGLEGILGMVAVAK